MLIDKNQENLVLLMNFKPNIFVCTFMIIKEDLFNFLEIVAEILFSSYYQYKYDNFYFFTECINEILDNFQMMGNMQVKF